MHSFCIYISGHTGGVYPSNLYSLICIVLRGNHACYAPSSLISDPKYYMPIQKMSIWIRINQIATYILQEIGAYIALPCPLACCRILKQTSWGWMGSREIQGWNWLY